MQLLESLKKGNQRMFGPYKFVDKLAQAINKFEEATNMTCQCTDFVLNTSSCLCSKGHQIKEAKKDINKLLKQVKRKKHGNA